VVEGALPPARMACVGCRPDSVKLNRFGEGQLAPVQVDQSSSWKKVGPVA